KEREGGREREREKHIKRNVIHVDITLLFFLL
uniref:Uncharacterized protein n=1 Tax=Amphimedon queenslandica TaxID=400682 RepID=A0A1X7UEE6_AMPQE